MSHQLTNPRCEYQTNPLGIGVLQPRFSWEIQSDAQGARQSAYQILAASEVPLSLGVYIIEEKSITTSRVSAKFGQGRISTGVPS